MIEVGLGGASFWDCVFFPPGAYRVGGVIDAGVIDWPPPASVVAGRWVNVLDYGAKGDGVTDDTAAINAAIAALGDPA